VGGGQGVVGGRGGPGRLSVLVGDEPTPAHAHQVKHPTLSPPLTGGVRGGQGGVISPPPTSPPAPLHEVETPPHPPPSRGRKEGGYQSGLNLMRMGD
jgi:hypothetical protein